MFDDAIIQLNPAQLQEGRVICSDLGAWGAEMHEHLRLRALLFGAKYREVVTIYRGGEIDRYDTPFATYLTRLSPQGQALGVVRLSPTDLPYMLKDHWPEMWKKGDLPNTPRVLEATRFGIHSALRGELRRRVKWELVCALLEYGLRHEIQSMVAVMQPENWKRVFALAGWDVERVGPEKMLDDELCHAIQLAVSAAALESVRRATGITYSVLAAPRGETIGERLAA